MSNLEKVQQIYAAFGKGDIPAILQQIDERVDWEYIPISADVPWLQHRENPAGVGQFFQSLGAMEFHRFNPTTLLADGDTVVVLFDLEVTVKATGKKVVEEDEVHIWHFGKNGKVIRFRHVLDTQQHWTAYSV